MTDALSSTKPYLIRAIHEWCADNGLTPYLAVSVDERTEVPREFVRAGEIVLNVSMSATDRLTIGNELITFQARFGGVARSLSIPIEQVSAIYARENGQGMAFEVPKPPALRAPTEADAGSDSGGADTGPQGADAMDFSRSQTPESTPEKSPKASGPSLSSAPPPAPSPAASPDLPLPPSPSPPTGGGRPKLTRVK